MAGLRRSASQIFKRVSLFSKQPFSSVFHTKMNPNLLPTLVSDRTNLPSLCCFSSNSWGTNWWGSSLWVIVAVQAATILELNAKFSLAEDVSIGVNPGNDTEGANMSGFRKMEDNSIISNSHTAKWRIFTDNGRDSFLKGKLEEAEKFFLSAVQEAKEGFGERDPHVASAYNNLAEFYRVMKTFDKAEPLYLEAINILEQSFGPEDIRVGAAFHNFGQFYFAQQKLEEAGRCYQRALKIKARVLGHGHQDYADTMYHLGTVLHLQRRDNDAEDLIHNSIRILEEGGQGESTLCIKRMRYLAQIYLKQNHLEKAENILRKIIHIMEISKGWSSFDTIIAAERLALTLQSVGSLDEAQDYLERCLDARKSLLPQDHIQIGANLLHIARIKMLKAKQFKDIEARDVNAELDKARDLLYDVTRIAQKVLSKVRKQKGNHQSYRAPEVARKDGLTALVILLQSLDTLGLVEITKKEMEEQKEEHSAVVEAENAFSECISTYKEFVTGRLIPEHSEVKAQYLSCLKHYSTLITKTKQSQKATLEELEDEIKRVETEMSHGKQNS